MLLLLACADLPEELEGATPVPGFQQSACLGDPNPNRLPYGSWVSITGGADVYVNDVTFRCDQRLEGFMLVEKQHVSLLVQPIDMDPEDPEECACLYNVDMHIVLTTGSYLMDVYRRGDHQGKDDEMALILTGEFAVP